MIEHRREVTPLAPGLTGRSSSAAGVPSRTSAEHVTLAVKAGRLRVALAEWKRAGYPKTPREERRRRRAICRKCEFWNPRGNILLGECLAPGCGCTRAKVWLATARCPLDPPKWPVWTPKTADPTVLAERGA